MHLLGSYIDLSQTGAVVSDFNQYCIRLSSLVSRRGDLTYCNLVLTDCVSAEF